MEIGIRRQCQSPLLWPQNNHLWRPFHLSDRSTIRDGITLRGVNPFPAAQFILNRTMDRLDIRLLGLICRSRGVGYGLADAVIGTIAQRFGRM